MRGEAWVDCPTDADCGGEVKVSFRVVPGEPEIRYPNDAAHPGSPDHAELESELEPCRECGSLSEEGWKRIERDRQRELLEGRDSR